MNIFNGNKMADEVISSVKELSEKLESTLKLVSIVVGDEKGALFYQNLKKKKAAEVGIDVEINKYPSDTKVEKLLKDIDLLNSDDSVNGIMIQLPLPDNFTLEDRDELIESIDSGKDVDGMKNESDFTSPVVRSVLKAFQLAINTLDIVSEDLSILVVGYSGSEGKKIHKAFKEMKYKVTGVDSKTKDISSVTKKADIIISATGVQELITVDMVKEGVVLIDVGSPKGDIEKAAYKKASFISPVPGGVGPLTIAYLMENIYESCK